ncbi:MAG: hypothetical protein JWO58_110 [Chitinophagaceae bacterium]|nr:hypothetical protein [Chitinophagaceae bacterium]
MDSIYFSKALKRTTKLFLFVVCTLCPYFLHAQGELALIDFKIKKPNQVDVLTTEDGRHIYCFFNSRQMQLTTVSTNYSFVSASFEMDKSLHHSDYLLSVRDGKYQTAFFYNERGKIIKTFRIDLSMGTTQTLDCGVIPKEEDFLNAFQLNQKFYLLTVTKGSSNLHLWESVQGNPLVKTSFTVKHPNLYATLRVNDQDLNERKYSDIGIDKVNYELENNLKSAHALNKLYLINGKIIITLDEPDQIWLYTIDPNTKTIDEKKLAFKLEIADEDKKTSKQGNSFLYNDKLFRVTANDEMLNVVMISLDSIRMEWNEKVFREQPILFKNGPIVTESGSSGAPKVVGKTSQYLTKVQNSRVAIAVNEINHQYLMQIGSYELKQSYNPYGNGMGGGGSRFSVGIGMGMGMGGMGMGMGNMGMGNMGYGGYGGGYGMPGYYGGYSGYYSNSGYSYVESTYFYSLIDAANLQHVDLAPPKTVREKLNDYEDQKFKKSMPDLITVTPLPDQTILMGYYFKSAHKYQLVEIR